VKKMIEDRLIALKLEKPELFYMTTAEQIGRLGALILKRLLSQMRFKSPREHQ
jgi:hypothetical protein